MNLSQALRIHRSVPRKPVGKARRLRFLFVQIITMVWTMYIHPHHHEGLPWLRLPAALSHAGLSCA